MSGSPASGDGVVDRIAAIRVVPVVEVEDAGRAVALAEALVEAGLPVLEVTLRTSAALAAVAAIAAADVGVLLGAGTLLTAEQVRAAAGAGAGFGVSPGTSVAALEAAAAVGLPFVPGVVTPSEVITCLDAGVTRLKVFPAGAFGGLALLTALGGALRSAGVRFMPTGGIAAAQLGDYLARPEVFAVGGTWVAPRGDIATGNWEAITARARAAAQVAARAATLPALGGRDGSDPRRTPPPRDLAP